MFELKPISLASIPGALSKAEKYRLLNEPRDAESICRDVLRTDPDNAHALVMLLLSLTDQFGKGYRVNVNHAKEALDRITDPYQKAYYAGIVAERWAKAQLKEDSPGYIIYEWLWRAMQHYEQAIELAAPGDDEAKLRWNACARIIKRNEHIRPRPEDHTAETRASFEDEVPHR